MDKHQSISLLLKSIFLLRSRLFQLGSDNKIDYSVSVCFIGPTWGMYVSHVSLKIDIKGKLDQHKNNCWLKRTGKPPNCITFDCNTCNLLPQSASSRFFFIKISTTFSLKMANWVVTYQYLTVYSGWVVRIYSQMTWLRVWIVRLLLAAGGTLKLFSPLGPLANLKMFCWVPRGNDREFYIFYYRANLPLLWWPLLQ